MKPRWRPVLIVWRALAGAAIVVLLALGALAGLRWWSPGAADHERHVRTALTGPGSLDITWLGVSAVLITDGTTRLLIDPYFTRPEGLGPLLLVSRVAPDEAKIRAGLAAARAEGLDAVLVSHSHHDHAMDAGLTAKLTGALLIGSTSTANIGRGAGMDEASIRLAVPGSPVALGAFRVTFIESRHAGATGGGPTGEITAPLVPPVRITDYRLGRVYSILIEHPLGTVLHHGSAGFVPGALKGRKADVVLLGVALIDDLDVYLHETVDMVGAQRIVPVHADDFTRPPTRPITPMPLAVRLDRFFADMARLRPALRIETLVHGRPTALFPR